MGIIKKILNWQWDLSFKFDKLLPEDMRLYGTKMVRVETVPACLEQGMKVYEIGGGKNPIIPLEVKERLELEIIGLDIDAEELKHAPKEIYNTTQQADIMQERGPADGDLVICRAVLEHVPNTAKALEGIASYLKPGGTAVVFLPGQYAAFTFINRILPESLKVKMLNYLYPRDGRIMGFKAYYNDCTPGKMKENAEKAGMVCTQTRIFYASNYFYFFTPLHIIWRLYQLGIRALKMDFLCETYIQVYKKHEGAHAAKAS